MIYSLINDWFGWPDGAVLTNLVASLIWGFFAWRKLHKIHKSHKELHRKVEHLHRKVDDASNSNSGVEGSSGAVGSIAPQRDMSRRQPD